MTKPLTYRFSFTLVQWLLAAMVFTSACNQSGSANQEESGNGDDKLRIAVIPKGTTHIFWKYVHAGAAKAAQELGVEIIWQGPQKEDDRQLQIQVVQNFVSREVDGIVLSPLDERSLVPPVKAARNRNIPVVIFDSDLASQDYESFVATDNYAGGKLAAQRMAEVLNKQGNVILLRYAEGSASTTARENGFLDGLKEYAPQIKIISSNQYAGATMEKAYQVSQNLLNRFGQVNGVFCANESSTQGMYRALQTSGKAGKVNLIGFDANETLLKAIRDGHIQGLAVQDPFRMGYEGVKTVVAVIQKKPYEKRLDTGVTMITPENMDTPENKVLLNPELDKWLDE